MRRERKREFRDKGDEGQSEVSFSRLSDARKKINLCSRLSSSNIKVLEGIQHKGFGRSHHNQFSEKPELEMFEEIYFYIISNVYSNLKC